MIPPPPEYLRRMMAAFQFAAVFSVVGFALQLVPYDLASAFGVLAFVAGALAVLRATYWMGRASEHMDGGDVGWSIFEDDEHHDHH